MKKIISLLLSIVVIIGALSVSVNAYAAGFAAYAKSIELNTWYTGSASKTDYHSETYETAGYYADIYKVYIPVQGTLSINIHAECEHYLRSDYYGFDPDRLNVYNSSDTHTTYYDIGRDYDGYDSFNGYYYSENAFSIEPGTYYIEMTFDAWDLAHNNDYKGTYDIQFKYSPSISKPSTFKVSSRNTTSIGLTWSKVGGVDGYQLQRKIGDSYKTIINTTSNSYTVSNLTAGTNYAFRVRSYIDVDGTKYCSGWKTLTTPTKPSKPSIKNPTTNSKHQIIAKWNTVSRCSGYQVQYSKYKSFSSVISTKTVSGQSKTSYTGKNFTKGKTYYVRVRAYKTVDGTKYYGAWSSIKTIKCK